ncbi:3-hydroxyisobutyrate dehydrogenase [Reyranella sp.]|uniref:3-hydroxyisobutyrate dehydrogenase n=1 Tax=Reyranella sp. TaxID=1929291 RepID=UPI001217ABED|nr:3-hydroxyisobutyrate dehydrogenase [Reyranella sp.]TAJ89996.1 MAG: 3-hydroxyisobutyrate dehydrogenase [Reyranella sp.]
MAKIAFIGLGNMGGPMAANLAKAQHHVTAFDLSDAALNTAVEKGAHKAASAAEAVKGAEIVVTMLPAGKHVREVYEKDVLPNVAKGTLLIDCSTIDVDSARHVAALADKAGMEMIDAPVSGGVGGATAGTLTFMVGGKDGAFAKAKAVLEKMGKNIVHAGGSGNGQAAKICNNMVLGVSMIAVSEAFMLAKRLGLDAQKLFDVASTSSGQCWSLTNYCPVPGPVPTSPANRDYQAGFTAAMMLKDLVLAQQAANAAGASTPLGAEAAQLFNLFVNSGHGGKDFSGIVQMLDGK